MFSFPAQRRWVLWFLALMLLCFVAGLVPAVRRRLLWKPAPSAEAEESG